MAVNSVSEVDLDSNGSILWAMHNPLKSWTLYDLSENEIKLIIRTLSDSELRVTRICRKNDKIWNLVDRKNHADLFNNEISNASSVVHADYPVVEVQSNSGSDAQYFIIKPSRVLHPRLHKRYELPIPCVLLGSNNKEFITETIDLSEGGLYLKDVIPNWIAGYFLVIVKSNFQLMCSLVEDQKEKKRVQIVSEESDAHFMEYKNWLSTL